MLTGMALLHSIRAGAAAVAVLMPAIAGAQVTPPPVMIPAASSFTIFFKAVPIGSEQIALTRSADGWTITSSGRMGAPIDVVARHVQVRYTDDWKPIEVTIDATVNGQTLSVQTIVTGATAQTHVVRAGQSADRTDPIPADAVLLPSPFWGPFEAVAARLKTAASGSTIQAFAGSSSYAITVGDGAAEQIQTAARLVDARRTRVTLLTPGMPIDADIWIDEIGRLLRITIPVQNIDVVREDIASVAARRVTISRPNDEAVKIPANGFSLAGTLSKPASTKDTTLPAVILVGGSGPTDRDETVFNVPVFGQLAGALADAGYAVLRYDKRGIGQSGGRAEAATLADYADDLRAAVKFMYERKDVDQRKLAILGHSEGGWVSMLVAAKDKHIAALVLVATIGVTGAELNMEQVTHTLDRAKRTDAERQTTLDLQKQIQTAVLTGKGWDAIPPIYRKQADTPWFQSFLAFDPAKVMPDVRQPILVVQGMLDTQVPPANADRLDALARARKNAPMVEVVKVPGINHLLLPATTGEFDEYSTLTGKRVSPEVATAVAAWLQKAFAAPRP
jgi:pimeloyl-ACP methyl ester carboxylesterase